MHVDQELPKTEENPEQVQAQERATWKAPQLERLQLSLDTAAEVGSAIDGFTGSLLF